MEQQEHEAQAHPVWFWTTLGVGAVAGAVTVVWMMQYRKPDRSMNRLLRRCEGRLDTIEESISDLELGARN